MNLLLPLFGLLLALVGIVGCIVPVLPGVVLAFAGLLCAWGSDFAGFSATALWIWAGVTLVVTLLDYLLPAWITRLFGGSRAGQNGATAGMLAGFLAGGPLGMLIGPFVGAVLCELIFGSAPAGRALQSGIGAFFSFLLGTGIKLAAAVAMTVPVWQTFWAAIRG